MACRCSGARFIAPQSAAHAPERLHEEIGADYTDMIYAATPEDIATRRKAFVRKWRLKHRPVADSLRAGDRLFTFTQLPPSQWRSARTTNAIEQLHEEFKRRIKTQTVLPSAETAAMLFWRCSPPVRSTCARSMAGRRSPQGPSISQLTSPLHSITSCRWRYATSNSNKKRDAHSATPQRLLRWFAFWGSGGAGNEVPHAFLRARIVEGIVQVLWSASGGVMEKHILSAGGPFENRPNKSRPRPHSRVERRPNWFAHPERLSHCSEIGWSKLGWLRHAWVGRAVRDSA